MKNILFFFIFQKKSKIRNFLLKKDHGVSAISTRIIFFFKYDIRSTNYGYKINKNYKKISY